jgi:hypothetical protein
MREKCPTQKPTSLCAMSISGAPLSACTAALFIYGYEAVQFCRAEKDVGPLALAREMTGSQVAATIDSRKG